MAKEWFASKVNLVDDYGPTESINKRTGIPSLYSASKPEAIRDSGGVRTVDEILGILKIFSDFPLRRSELSVFVGISFLFTKSLILLCESLPFDIITSGSPI